MDRAERLARVAAVPIWFHTIDVGDGVSTPGVSDPALLDRIGLPADLRGKRVLDVGAWDGFYSFAAEERGASVLATDAYVWSPSNYGMDGFLTARELRSSNVSYKTLDVFDITPEAVGMFDITLFLGVLYHLREPLRALEMMAAVTTERIIVETQITFMGGRTPLARFYETDELYGDATNWWSPNLPCLVQMVRSSGFPRVEVVWTPPEKVPFHGLYRRALRRDGRAVVHGFK